MSIKNLFNKFLTGLFICGLLGLHAGCGETSNATIKKQTPQPASSSDIKSKPDLVAGIQLQQVLVGVWLGEAYLDAKLVEEKLQSLPPQRQQEVVQHARAFLSTVMAIDFRSDGTMENEVELKSLDGQPLREGGTASWRVIEANDDRLLVETSEQLADGTTTVDKQLYRVYPDGNRMALVVLLNDDLGSCNPMIVFARQTPTASSLAEQSATRVK